MHNIQWCIVYPDTFVPGQNFRINKFSRLLNRPLVQTWKSVPTLFVRISEISGLSDPGLTNHHCKHVLQMSCMWIKDGFHFKFNSAQNSGLPTELPTISVLASSGLPTVLPTKLPTVSIYVSSGQPNLHGKIPMGSPLRCPLSCPLFSYFGSSGLPTELPTALPTVSIFGSSGQPNLHGKIPMGSPLRCPRAAHGQLPCFFHMGR